MTIIALLLWFFLFESGCAEGSLSVLADESLVLGRDVEIQLEVRPVSDSGLLLHAGMSPDQHLSLVLSQGEVRPQQHHAVCFVSVLFFSMIRYNDIILRKQMFFHHKQKT